MFSGSGAKALRNLGARGGLVVQWFKGLGVITWA